EKRQGDLFAAAKEVIELTEETRTLLVASARGYGFRAAPEMSVTTRAGRRFARVAPGDELVSVSEPRGREVLCLTRGGRGLRFPLGEVTELAGAGRGVILMRLDAADRLLGTLVPEAGEKVVAAMQGGGERRLAADDFPRGRRGGKGLRVVKRGTSLSFAV